MTRDEKELLFKDLSARLPYNVYVDRIGIPHKLIGVNSADKTVTINNEDYMPTTFFINASEIPVKPYLRPMSSMTEEEKKRYDNILTKMYYHEKSTLGDISDYLNSIHVDYRGLIEKGLAIKITEENNPYNK